MCIYWLNFNNILYFELLLKISINYLLNFLNNIIYNFIDDQKPVEFVLFTYVNPSKQLKIFKR